jgi:pentapeptide repeat protein
MAGWTLAAILALAAAAVYGLALWRAPDWMHGTTPQDRYNARVLVISIGGAIVVGTGLLYTARNYRLSRRGQITDRFTIALERLGSSELYVRIGGVHALQHVMRDSAGHHDDVIEVLTEFIRGRTPRRARQSDHQVWMHSVTGSVPDLPPYPTADIQAALTALGHRPYRPERQTIDLPDLHLTGARLDGANLTGASLDFADLTGARFDRANLTGAIWPASAAVPGGWQCGDGGRLERNSNW